MYGDPRPERLAVEHETVRRDPLMLKKIERRCGVGVQAVLGRRARIAAIAAILQHQYAKPIVSKAAQALDAVADMAAIAVEIDDDRAALARRQVPGEERQPVGCRQHNLADAERREVPELGASAVGEIEQLALESIETPDQHRIDGQ